MNCQFVLLLALTSVMRVHIIDLHKLPRGFVFNGNCCMTHTQRPYHNELSYRTFYYVLEDQCYYYYAVYLLKSCSAAIKVLATFTSNKRSVEFSIESIN